MRCFKVCNTIHNVRAVAGEEHLSITGIMPLCRQMLYRNSFTPRFRKIIMTLDLDNTSDPGQTKKIFHMSAQYP